MRSKQSLYWILWLLCLLLMNSTSAIAQDVPNREDNRPAVRVTIGTRDDNWVYYTPDQPDFNRVIAVLNRAIPVYEQLTGITWSRRVVIVYTGSGGATVIGRILDSREAYVTRREPAALFAADPMNCHIRISAGWDTIPNFEAVVARQFFHCFQMETGAAQFSDFSDVVFNFWWLQGTAEWAASRVYPELYPQDIHIGFFDPRQDVRRARYDAYFFWEFASSARGFGSDRNVITQMNMLREDGVFPFVFNLDSVDLFHNWAQVLLDRQLPEPPIVDLTAVDLTAGKGGSIQSTMPPFSVDYRNLISFDLKPGNIAVLTVSGIDAGHFAVSARLGGATQRLQENMPLEFCPPDDGVMLILSRGEGARNTTAPLTITWTQQPSANPCTDEPDEPEGDASCIVGTWQVINYPASIARVDGVEVDTSEFLFSFGADGSMSGAYDIIARADGITLDLHFPFNGTYALRPLEGSSTQLAVRSWNWTFEAGGSYTATYRDGTQTDFTDQFYETGGIDLWSPDGTVECSGDTLSWETADGTGGFEMQRQ
ncbi:MAG: hypothetical protein IPK17_30265 [Chloroflexi bacterium]|uniref:hypothetical protein n=1 Tax=Candidatus Flexifilum breve TaxID=3140694 RepID=UPI003134D6D5|nr:hypothetical protein [Chloroflexota bacterium]